MFDFKPERRYTKAAVYVLIFIAFTALCVFIGVYFRGILGFAGKLLSVMRPLLYGLLFAYLLNPFVSFNEKKLAALTDGNGKKPHPRLRRTLAVVIAVLLVLALCALFAAIVLPQIADSYFDLTSGSDRYYSAAQDWLAGIFRENPALLRLLGGGGTVPDNLFVYGAGVPNVICSTVAEAENNAVLKAMKAATLEAPERLARELLGSALGSLSALVGDVVPLLIGFVVGSVSELLNVLVCAVFTVYVLFAKEKLLAACSRVGRAILPQKAYSAIASALSFAHGVNEYYFIGRFLTSMILGVVCFVLLALLGVPYAALISLIAAVFNIVPYVGVFIGGVIGVVILIFAAPRKIIVFLLILAALALLDTRYISDKLLPTKAFLSPAWTIIAVIVCGGLIGFAGMFIAVPLFTLLYYLTDKYIIKKERKGQ